MLSPFNFLWRADLSIPINLAILDTFPPNFLSWMVKYSFSKCSLASFNGTDNDFSELDVSALCSFKDSLIIVDIFSSLSGESIAIRSIKFLNSLTLPGQL